MFLQEKMNIFKADLDSGKPPYNAPKWMIDTMARGTQELIDSNAAAAALKAGDMLPAFALKDSQGNLVSSDDLLKKGPLVITFYRGVWCPYCNMELQALQAALPEIERRGATLIAISPQTAVNSRKSIKDNGLDFLILSDPGNELAAKFGLRFKLPDYTIELYRDAFKNDLTVVNGDPSWTLPMPARYVVRQDGQIVDSEVSPDYTKRPEPDSVFPAIEEARVTA